MRAPGCLVSASLGLCLFLGGVVGDVLLLRSFEFLPFPKSVAPFTPPEPPPAPAVAPVDSASLRTQGVTILWTDGMRLDRSRELPAFEALRQEGADVVTRCLFPTFTRVGQATMQSGAGPRVHGYTANYNKRRAKVTSVGDVARAAGIHTRFFAPAIRDPYMFPEASVERAEFAPELLAKGPRPHSTMIYLHEPDATAHRLGGSGEAYDEASLLADRQLAEIRAQLDLTTETLIVGTDHGHIDRGGHGGHEEVVYQIPLILAGAGIKPGVKLGPEAGSDLRDVAPTVAWLLGLPPLPHATGRPLYEVLAEPPPESQRVERGPRHPEDPAWALLLRALLGLLPGALALALTVRHVNPSLRQLGSTLVGPIAFLALYLARGYPLSYSCVNAEAEVPLFMLEVLVLGIAAAAIGAWLADDRRRWGPLSAAVALIPVLTLGVACGWGAPTGLAYPALSFHAHMGLTYAVALGLVIPFTALGREEPAPPTTASD
jgi:hypothetical protein